MTTIYNPAVQARASLTVTGLSTLASATYVASSAYALNTNKPADLFVEVTVGTTNTPSGNKQVLVFAVLSLDGTNYTTGPTSGTTATDEPDLYYLGAIPIPVASVNHTRIFALSQLFTRPVHSLKIVIKNDLGVALTTGAVYTSEVSDVTN